MLEKLEKMFVKKRFVKKICSLSDNIVWGNVPVDLLVAFEEETTFFVRTLRLHRSKFDIILFTDKILFFYLCICF